jgi:N6-adenosine-specific RNA methylase IME4
MARFRFTTNSGRPETSARGTVIVDAPWQYGARGFHYKDDEYYRTLDVAALKALPIGELADYLFLWRTVAFGEQAFRLVRHWGFEPVTELFWIKADSIALPPELHGRFLVHPPYGVGYWFRGVVEPIIVAKKPGAPLIRSNYIGLLGPAVYHSRKPDSLHQIIERHYPQPFLELFARRQRIGWTCLGNELDGEDIAISFERYLRTARSRRRMTRRPAPEPIAPEPRINFGAGRG